ncbi:hypothetical protein SFR_0937 [Streptomyces sp. FR-008]|nr:hypothetical protein SFR_0937 [Streptomyces sp. FR-008]
MCSPAGDERLVRAVVPVEPHRSRRHLARQVPHDRLPLRRAVQPAEQAECAGQPEEGGPIDVVVAGGRFPRLHPDGTG